MKLRKLAMIKQLIERAAERRHIHAATASYTPLYGRKLAKVYATIEWGSPREAERATRQLPKCMINGRHA